MANVVWFTKKSLTEASAEECEKWGFKFIPLVGTTPEKDALLQTISSVPNYPVHIIVNYEYLNSSKVLHQLKWNVICVDEVHRLKGGANLSGPTLLWKNLKKLIQENPDCFPMFLSGSIVNNRPEELWAYLHLFNPTLFPTRAEFFRLFTNGGVLRTDKLVEAIAPNMLRRTKKEVGIQIPEKFWKTHKIELEGELREIYKKLFEQAIVRLESMGDKPLSMANFLQVCHYCRAVLLAPGLLKYNYYPVDPLTGEVGSPEPREFTFKQPYVKLNYAFELACEIMDEGENVIIFTAQYNKPLEYMKQLFEEIGKKVLIIRGDTKNAMTIQNEFQQSEGNTVLLINLMSGAEGLNLQTSEEWPGGASQAIFLDRWWNPERNRQGEDRIWRTGTMHPVTIHLLQVEGTTDALIEAICQQKIAMRESIVESTALRPSEWIQILKDYLK